MLPHVSCILLTTSGIFFASAVKYFLVGFLANRVLQKWWLKAIFRIEKNEAIGFLLPNHGRLWSSVKSSTDFIRFPHRKQTSRFVSCTNWNITAFLSLAHAVPKGIRSCFILLRFILSIFSSPQKTTRGVFEARP